MLMLYERVPWKAPLISRQNTPYGADERQMLEAWLGFHRQTLLGKFSGLTAEQLRQRAVPRSHLSLLGLVRHMAEVERGWFRRRVAGQDVGFLYSSEADPDGEFDHVDTADAKQDIATCRREIELARQASAGRELDETFFHSRRNAQMSVRWVFVHMIEEYARHNGHADLLRERIDGAQGSDGQHKQAGVWALPRSSRTTWLPSRSNRSDNSHFPAHQQRGRPDRRPLPVPGRHAGRPVGPVILANRLRALGIGPAAMRNTARARLAAEIPPAMLGELIGVGATTANRWATVTNGTWLAYAATQPDRACEPHVR
jgi:uncharacterized damage-inducible protein DinB